MSGQASEPFPPTQVSMPGFLHGTGLHRAGENQGLRVPHPASKGAAENPGRGNLIRLITELTTELWEKRQRRERILIPGWPVLWAEFLTHPHPDSKPLPAVCSVLG